MEIFLIIVAVALVATYAYVKIRERQEERDDLLGDDRPITTADLEDYDAPIELAEVEELEELEDYDDLHEPEVEVEEIDLEEVAADEEPATSSWLTDIAEPDDDALSTLGTAEPEPEIADELDDTSVDEEFESITADLSVAVDDDEIEVKEEVESADDIMANSKATEINPAGNSELQNLLQKVQARLSEYE